VLVAALAGAASLVAGSLLVSPVNHPVGPPPADLNARAVEIRTADGGVIRGWFVPGRRDAAGVALAHGIRADRRSMLNRARFLSAAGYSVLLFDLQGHGESPGEHITFGYKEAEGVEASVQYLRQHLSRNRVGVIGCSLGGAACLLGRRPVEADAVILEAVYPDIGRATANRLSIVLGPFGDWLAPLLTVQVRSRLGISLEDLSPIERIGLLRAPVLVIGGTNDRRTTVDDTRSLFATAREPKELWLIPGAAHVDFCQYDETAYRRRVLDFFARFLGSEPTDSPRVKIPR